MADVGVYHILTVDTKLPQFLVCGATPLRKHEVVVNSVCLVERWQISDVFLDCLRSPKCRNILLVLIFV